LASKRISGKSLFSSAEGKCTLASTASCHTNANTDIILRWSNEKGEIMTTKQLRLHATIEGRVQGVGFRFFVTRAAGPLNLTGWVRNRWNGNVEVIAEGSQQSLDNLLAALRRGPHPNTSQHVQISWEPAIGEFKRFRVRRTG
jgi:acylphosphatase